tara:strand:+ start:87 stop:479 length:393 start_codon:yes stop_codon:yes gene_type:complete
MLPRTNPVLKKVAHPANGMYGRIDHETLQPKVQPTSTLERSKKLNNVLIPSMQKSMGIEYNPYALSRGCRSINDLRKVKMGNTSNFNEQLLNAKPKTWHETADMVYERTGMMGANFKQNNQLAHITTWST